MLFYRMMTCCRKIFVKLLHTVFHAFGIACIAIGFLTVWDSHELASPKIPNFYSLHSWLGLTTMGLFAIQVNCDFSLNHQTENPVYALSINYFILFRSLSWVSSVSWFCCAVRVERQPVVLPWFRLMQPLGSSPLSWHVPQQSQVSRKRPSSQSGKCFSSTTCWQTCPS